MPYNSRNFGIVISRLRTAKGMSQEQLSGLAGISRSHLAMLENGRKTARLDTLWKLAEALDVTADELIIMTERVAESNDER